MIVCLFRKPTHHDAVDVWPIVRPAYVALLAARYGLEQYYPVQSRFCHRMANELAELMIEAEVGMLNQIPERKAAAALRFAKEATDG